MKKTLKWIGIGVLTLFVATAILSGWYLYKFNSETKLMQPVSTSQVSDGVFAIKDGFTNCYFVKAGEELIAFDAGNEAVAVLKGMQSLGLDPSKVKAVFLTHTDFDHVAALGHFSNAQVYLSSEEEQMLDGRKHRFLLFDNRIGRSHAVIRDGEELTVGSVKVKGILTPGHTPGSMSYLVNARFLFTGDTLSLQPGKVQRFNDFFNMDPKTEEQSIRKLAGIKGVQVVLTAHYGTTSDPETAFRDW